MENRRPLLASMVWPCYTGVFSRVLRGWYWKGLRCTGGTTRSLEPSEAFGGARNHRTGWSKRSRSYDWERLTVGLDGNDGFLFPKTCFIQLVQGISVRLCAVELIAAIGYDYVAWTGRFGEMPLDAAGSVEQV